MKTLPAICVALGLIAAPLQAQEAEPDFKKGLDLLQEGTRLLLEGLMQELGPALEDLQDKVIDLNAYHAPEMLPNGDIIIRRKTPLEMDRPSNDIDI